jgi:hypothetical protein
LVLSFIMDVEGKEIYPEKRCKVSFEESMKCLKTTSVTVCGKGWEDWIQRCMVQDKSEKPTK